MGGTGGTGGDVGPAPVVDDVERLGAYQPAPPQSLLAGVNRPLMLVGLDGSVVDDTALFGLGDPANPGQSGMSAGLLVQDTDTGAVRLYGAADGLPELDYGLYVFGGKPAAAPVIRLAWIDTDERFAAAMLTHVAVGTRADDGTWSFRSSKLRKPGATTDSQITVVASAAGALFVGSDQGVAVLDPDTLSVTRWLDTGTPISEIYELVSVGFDEAKAAVAWNQKQNAGGPNRISIASAGSPDLEEVTLPDGFLPTCFAGTTGALYVGGRAGDGRGAILAVTQLDDGYEARMVVAPEDLVALHRAPYVPNRIAVSADGLRLFVGAQLQQSGDVKGVAVFELMANAVVMTPGRLVVDRRRAEADLLPWQTELLVADAKGRLWVAGKQRCNDVSRRITGLFRIDGVGDDPETARVVRPFVSGVRTISVDPVDGNTWLGLRDENSGLACDGYVVQQSVCRLKSDGSCEIWVPRTNTDLQRGPVALAAVGIAFDPERDRALAVVGIGDETFVRRGDTTRFLSTQLEPGVSLRTTSAAIGPSGLWISSAAQWDPGFPPDPNDPNPIDWDKVNDRTPHGVGYLEFDADGKPTYLRRFSRNKSDQKDYDVPGMPSNAAWQVLPLEGRRRAVVALGVERPMQFIDHQLPPESDRHVGGGIAIIDGDQVRTVSGPSGATLRDVVALARDQDGGVFAVEANEGVFRVNLETRKAERFAAPAWGPQVRATSLAVDEAGHVAVGTTAGLWIYGSNGKSTQATARDHGTYWALRFMEDGVLYAGADQGLVRVAIDGAMLPAVLGPSGPLPRYLWPLEFRCDGEEGCACFLNEECAAGLECGDWGPETGYCIVPVERCDVTPGDIGCGCESDDDCITSFECVGGACTTSSLACMRSCECGDDGCPADTRCLGGFTAASCVPVAPNCLASCTCDGADGCPATYHCESGIMAPRCVPSGDCRTNCSCPVNDGCPDGWQCQGGFAGRSCVEVLDPCLADCSCPDIDGCTDGYHCEWNDDGQTCVEDPDPCLMNCTCGGTGQCLPGYVCRGGIAGSSCVEE